MRLKILIKKKFYNLKFPKKNDSQIKDQVILITGISLGIGLGICKKLIKDNKDYNGAFINLLKNIYPSKVNLLVISDTF